MITLYAVTGFPVGRSLVNVGSLDGGGSGSREAFSKFCYIYLGRRLWLEFSSVGSCRICFLKIAP